MQILMVLSGLGRHCYCCC